MPRFELDSHKKVKALFTGYAKETFINYCNMQKTGNINIGRTYQWGGSVSRMT
jgi:hypothetical protein